MTLINEMTESHLETLVHRFYATVRIDPLIGPVFNAAVANWDEHLDTLTKFWCTVMLANRSYKGNPLAAHLEIPITPEMFHRWLALWSETVDAMFEPSIAEQLRNKAFRMGRNMQFALFQRVTL